MYIDASKLSDAETFNTSICIVGGGVAGLVLARELLKLRSQLNVILLESGEESYNVQAQKLYEPQSVTNDFSNPLHSRLRMLGGSSNHWENSIERLDPIDFSERNWVPNSGWPISYNDLEPLYSDAEDYCGIGRDGFDLDYWKSKIPFNDLLIGSEHFFTSIVKAPLIPTRFYKKLGNGLKSNPNIKIIKNANLTDLAFDLESATVTSVHFKSLNYNTSHTVRADIFVFCMGGIENCRVLKLFNKKYEGQLGDQFDNVGRYFMEHPTIRGMHLYPFDQKLFHDIYQAIPFGDRLIRARFKLKEKTQKENGYNNLRFFLMKRNQLSLSHGVSSTHILLDDLSEGDLSSDFGMHLSNILGDIDLVADSITRKVLDEKLFDSSDNFGGYQLITMIEQAPSRDNTVTLGHEKDQLGLNKVIIKVNISDSDKELTWKTLSLLSKDPTLQKICKPRLLMERNERLWGSQIAFGQHHMGGTRMSNSEKTGVVDKNCKVFGTKNLFVAGSSVFPTGGHVPPTLTIVALTIRLAKKLVQLV